MIRIIVVALLARLCSACDRSRSAEARIAIAEGLQPRLADIGLGIRNDTSCPLSLASDVYYHWETSKTRSDQGFWKCASCGKQFRTETYLEAHFKRKHPDLIQNSSGICLSDACPIIGCSSHTSITAETEQQEVLMPAEQRHLKCVGMVSQCATRHNVDEIGQPIADSVREELKTGENARLRTCMITLANSSRSLVSAHSISSYLIHRSCRAILLGRIQTRQAAPYR